MTSIKLLGYNMSYASDLGINPENTLKTFVDATGFKFVPSELNFLLNKKRKTSTIPLRSSWNKAFGFLKSQITELNPTVIGLQEMNRWYNYSNQIETFGQTGYFYKSPERPKRLELRTAVEMKLNNDEFGYTKDFNEISYGIAVNEPWTLLRGVEKVVDMIETEFKEYDYFHDEVLGETVPGSNDLAGRFSVMTIWHKPTLGEFFSAQVFPFKLDNARPVLFVVVVKDGKYTLLINLHSPNKAPISMANYSEIKDDIIAKYNQFLANTQLTSFENVFMVGDFNDRYGGLLSEESRAKFRNRETPTKDAPGPNLPIPSGEYSGEFELADNLKLTFNSDSAPISCCYNWDSTKSQNSKSSLDGDIPDDKTSKKSPLPEDRAKEYYYLGDYIFSSKGGKLSVVSADVDYSDHKMVMLEIPLSTGGRRRYSTRNLKRRTKKGVSKNSRASRKKITHKK